jgi:hypothetical protein
MSERSCDWCGRPESEQKVEPAAMMLCEECLGTD